MCGDFGIGETIFAITAILSAVASTAVSVTSSVQESNAAKAQAEYQARVQRENAKIAEENAAIERQQGIEEERMQRLKTARQVASQKTAMAANGIDISQGTALDVIEDTATMGELDALQTRYNYERQAIAYEAQANNFNNQANLDIIKGQNAQKAGYLKAASSGLAGINQSLGVAGKWYDFGGGTSKNSGQLTGWTPSI